MMRIELTLPLPPSTNHLYKTIYVESKRTGAVVPRRAKSEEAKKYDQVVWLAVLAKYRQVKMKKPIRIFGTLYMPDRTGIDVDNTKCLVDSLTQACGVNDRWLDANYWGKAVAKGNTPEARVLVLDADEPTILVEL